MASEQKDQVAAQCMTVAYLARALADVHTDLAVIFAGGCASSMLDSKGQATAFYMQVLGNILNGMDAVTDDDDQFAAVFLEAQKRWPVSTCPQCGSEVPS